MSTAQKILALVECVRADERQIGVLSTGEALAVALVLNRPDLMPVGYTTLEAVERLGEDWTRAALVVQRCLGPEPSRASSKRAAP